jgi:hypothetical protein
VNAGLTEQQAHALVCAIRDVAQEIRQARENAKMNSLKSTRASLFGKFFKF